MSPTRTTGFVEAVPRPITAPRRLVADAGRTEVLNGVVGAIFSMTGPVAVILAAADGAGLSQRQTGSWIFGVFFLNGLLTIVASWLYRQPLAFFWTIPGTVVVGQAATHLPWSDVIGAYVLTALLLVVLGVGGRVDRLMAALPMPIVMAMVAGVFLGFGTGLVEATAGSWSVAVPMVAAFVVAALVAPIGRWLPPIIAALLAGVAMVLVGGDHGSFAGTGDVFAHPVMTVPTFSWAASSELVIPLAVTVVFVQNAQGMAVLAAAGHRAPMRFATIVSGLWSLLAAAVGAVATCLTGPTNALLTASGRRERQYVAAITCGAVAVCFGLVAPAVVGALTGMPPVFVAVLAGLALLKALAGSFSAAFSAPEVTAPLLTFLVTVSGVDVANLGAPFWGLVTGWVATRLVTSHALPAAVVNPSRPGRR